MQPLERATLGLFDDSLQRCNAHPRFLDRFYEIFLESSPAVAEKFAHTDFEHQKRMVRASFYLIVASSQEEGGPERYLDRLARRHSIHDADVGPELYHLWLQSLLEAVRECDPEWTPEVEAAWRETMQIGVRYLVSRYRTG